MCIKIDKIAVGDILYRQNGEICAGRDKIAYHIVGNDEHVIIIAKRNSQVDISGEINVCERMLKYRKYTHSIMWICKWGYIGVGQLYYITPKLDMTIREYGRMKRPNIDYTSHNNIRILFEITVALMMMAREGCQHDNISEYNIMLKNVDYTRLYDINGKHFSIDIKWLPVLIDTCGINNNRENYVDPYISMVYSLGIDIPNNLRNALYETLNKGNTTFFTTDIFDSICNESITTVKESIIFTHITD